MLNIHCPECQSQNIRSSLSRSLGERIFKAFGYFQFRCKDCDARFSGQIWEFGNLLWARCPRCYRLDLSTWQPQYYRAPTRWLIMIKLGAKTHRCEYCRCNFVSFRPAKFKFVRRKTAAEMQNGTQSQPGAE